MNITFTLPRKYNTKHRKAHFNFSLSCPTKKYKFDYFGEYNIKMKHKSPVNVKQKKLKVKESKKETQTERRGKKFKTRTSG